MIIMPNAPVFKYKEKLNGESVIYAKKVPPEELEEIKKLNEEYKEAAGEEFIKVIY